MKDEYALPDDDHPAATEEKAARACDKCGGVLGAANKSGHCSPCQRKHPFTAGPPRIRVGPKPSLVDRVPTAGRPVENASPTRLRFDQVSRALGYDPDELLEPHMRAWLDRIDAAARPVVEGSQVIAGIDPVAELKALGLAP